MTKRGLGRPKAMVPPSPVAQPAAPDTTEHPTEDEP